MANPLDQFRETADVRQLRFAEFTTDLITDVADALVASTIKQIRSFSDLIRELAEGVEAFQEKNAGPAAVQEYLRLQFPNADGSATAIQVEAEYGRALYNDIVAKLGAIEGLVEPEEGSTEFFTEENVTAIRAAAQSLLMDRASKAYEQLENLVRLGYARVVFDDGHILTKLRFNVRAIDSETETTSTTTTSSYSLGGGLRGGLFGMGSIFGWAGLSFGGRTSKITVETVDTQSQEAVTADARFIGEVRVDFKTETFDLEKIRLQDENENQE